jgi:patatin-like phospholipase/acyl hydrolase
MADPLRVLSIDGGGIRGLIPALVLAELEDRSGRRVADLFDLVAGTSTGGIIALALTMPAQDGSPRWRASDLVELYATEGPHIFHASLFDRVRSGGGVLDERYPADGIETALAHYFGEARLSQTPASVDVLVSAYETRMRSPFFFRSQRARVDPSYDFRLREVARATSAAPTYFEPLRLVNEADSQAYSLIDGGVFANNPAMCALADALAGHVDREVTMLSLGTGALTRPLPWEQIKDWGLAGWARPLIDVIFDGVSDTIDFQVRQVLGEGGYWRLQTELTRASDDLDDSRPGNLELLRAEASALIERAGGELDQALARLTV